MSTTTSPDTGTRIASRLAKTLGPRRYAMWFDRSARFDYRDGEHTLRVAVPNRFIADWIGRNFQRDLQEAAREEVGRRVQLDVQVAPDRFDDHRAAGSPTAADDAGDAPAAADAAAGARRGTTPRPAPDQPARASRPRHLRRRLSEFIVGSSNELAYAAACRLADADVEPAGPLFLHGACGVGKTHLLQGVCRRLLDHQPNARVLYSTGEQFTNDYITAVRANKLEAFRKRIRQLDLLAVDDVHFIANKQATQQEFLHSFDQIELGGARVVLASDCHPKLIKQFSEALVSRCVRGLVVQIATPDADTRQRLVEALAKRRGLLMEPAVVQMLASRMRGSVRDIEGTLTKLQAMAALNRTGGQAGGTNTLVGHALVRQLFDHDTDHPPSKPVRFDTVLECVCERLGVTRAQVLGRSRHRLIVLGRSLVIHLTRELTSMSYPEIAQAMGRKNHSTVITAAQRITRQLACDTPTPLPAEVQATALNELVDDLRDAIRRA